MVGELQQSDERRKSGGAARRRPSRLRIVHLLLFGSNPWPVAGGAGHLAMAVMTSIAVVFVGILALTVAHGDPNHGFFGLDFIAYFTGGTIVANGEAHRLFELGRQREVQRSLLMGIGVTLDSLNEYANPPLWAALVAVLQPVGLLAGVWLWRIVTILVPAAVLLVIGAQGPRVPGWQRAAALPLCFFPFVDAWYIGQMAALLLLAFGGWLALTRARHPRLAGLCLSLVLLKPQYAPFLVIFLAWKRQWTQLLGFAAGAGIQALLTLAMFLVVGQAPSLESLQLFAGGGGEGPHVGVLNLTIRGAIWHLFPAMDGRLQLVLLAILTIAAMGGFLAMIGREWDPATRRFAWETLALNAFVCVTAFHSLLLNLYLILPPAVAVLAAGGGQRVERRWLAPALAALLCVPSLGFAASPQAYEPYYLAGWITALGAVGLGLTAHHALLHEEPIEAVGEAPPPTPAAGGHG